MPTSYPATEPHIDAGEAWPQVPTRRQLARYWSAVAVTIALLFMLAAWWIHSPGQDHTGSIPLNGDGTWFRNYEVGFEIQDLEIFFDDIGHSVENARQADIIFLGWSRLLFGMDWRLFEDFERKHQLKMFNMGLADVYSGDFSLRIARKWGLHPKLWVINAERDIKNMNNTGFFYMNLFGGSGSSMATRVVGYSRLRAYRNVLGRNIRWRLKMALGLLGNAPYRSATTGNWYLDDWPNYASDNNPRIKSRDLHLVDGALNQTERLDPSCPTNAEEVDEAKRYVEAIGGAVFLIQMPSAFACAQRVQELASALAVPAYTVDPTQFSTTDGGGHLDGISARKYTTTFFGWLEQQPKFRELFSRSQ
jgi:hypothetical protein